MIDPIISKSHPEGVYMLICVLPKTSGDFLLVSVKKSRFSAVKNIANRFAVWGESVLHTTQLFFWTAGGDQLGRDPKEWRWDEPRLLVTGTAGPGYERAGYETGGIFQV